MMLTVKAISSNIFSQQPDFSCVNTGKCIVAGEHAVLRGAPAIVVPIKSRFLTLHYWADRNDLSVHASGENIIAEKLNLQDFFVYALDHLHKDHGLLKGAFHFEFNIPIASGLGTSACIAVAFARWCLWAGWINESQLFTTAHLLENFFHGTSSGVDVAAVLYGKPMIYQQGQVFEIFEPTWIPTLFLSATGKFSETAEAIAKAMRANAQRVCQGTTFDKEMTESVRLVRRALIDVPQKGFSLLKEALNKAHGCFHAWGLTQNKMVKQHIEILRAMGAVALKQTGAGDGGYILSLWEQEPQNPPFEMIKVF